jgi:hypothetical protein
MIVDIKDSPVEGKRFRAYVKRKNGQIEYYDFGYAGGKTYIDGRTKLERQNYLARHLGNKTEFKLVNNLVPSPSLLSAYLLWGKSTNLQKNVDYLNSLWKQKHG